MEKAGYNLFVSACAVLCYRPPCAVASCPVALPLSAAPLCCPPPRLPLCLYAVLYGAVPLLPPMLPCPAALRCVASPYCAVCAACAARWPSAVPVCYAFRAVLPLLPLFMSLAARCSAAVSCLHWSS